jgi:hypothetical protein
MYSRAKACLVVPAGLDSIAIQEKKRKIKKRPTTGLAIYYFFPFDIQIFNMFVWLFGFRLAFGINIF